jgi:hypothetical protein
MHEYARRIADERLTAGVNYVEDFDKPLALDFRHGLAHRLADDFSRADQSDGSVC